MKGAAMHDHRAFRIARFSQSYRLVRSLGRGGTAFTFEVLHLPTGERRVTRLHPEAALFDTTLALRMQQQAQILRRLRQPNVVRALGWGKLANGHPFLVLEHLEGITVAEAVRRRSVTLGKALVWASQALGNFRLLRRRNRPRRRRQPLRDGSQTSRQPGDRSAEPSRRSGEAAWG